MKKDTNYKTTCICRVPKADLEEGKLVMCKHCGCRGCGSSDWIFVENDVYFSIILLINK